MNQPARWLSRMWAWLLAAYLGLAPAGLARAEHVENAVIAQRRTRVAALSPAEKDQLRQQQERFAALPADEQEKLRQLDQQLGADPRADELRRVMARYYEWLKQLHPAVREELRRLPAEQRLARVQELRRDERNRSGSPLQPADRQVLLAWLEGVVEDKLSDEEKRQWEQLSPDERRRAMRNQLQKRMQQPKGRAQRLPELSAEQVADLLERLSPSARLELESKPDPQSQRRLLGQWLVQTLRSDEAAGVDASLAKIPPAELDRFRREIMTAEQRQQLEQMPPFARQRRLRMMYFHWKYPDRPGRKPRAEDPALEEPDRPNPGGRRSPGGPGGKKRRPANSSGNKRAVDNRRE
ncbi:MAG: hypothetical protein AB7O62_26540 [Pirellulales bacterium]